MPYPLSDPLKPKPVVQSSGTPKPAIAQPDPLQAPTEPAPTLSLGFTVVPLADMRVASEVAAHLGLPMPVLPAALVTQTSHA